MNALDKQKKETTQRDCFGEREIVASAMECTGLIPALTDADPDGELHDAALYGIHAPKKRDGVSCEAYTSEHTDKA